MIQKIAIDAVLQNKNSRAYHFVCQASMGYTTLGTFALDFDEDSFCSRFADEVNRRKEVGTLYPKYNISCYPVPNDDEINNPKYYESFIMDALNLHRLHIQCAQLVYIFDNYGNDINKELAVQTLEKTCESISEDWEFKIFYTLY